MPSGNYSAFYQQHLMVDTNHAPGGIVIYYADGDEEIIHVNQYILDLFECDDYEEFLELTQGSFKHFVHEDDVRTTEDSIWGQVGDHDGYDHIFYRIQTKNGNLVMVDDFGRLVHDGRFDRPIFEVFIARVTTLGSVDWITGLPGMTRFHDLARMGAKTIAERGQRPAAVAFDLMGMKTYNTRFGRDAGDRLLSAFADVLRRFFGGEACSRFGGDQFYAFANDAEVAQKVEGVFAQTKAIDLEGVPPVRAGIYVCDDEDDIVATGFDRAKIACDLDRKTWESHCMWFTDEMRAAERLRLHVLESVDQAIAEGWVRPFYQAVVRSSTSDICGEEALARWVDPIYGMLSPAQFIPDLEEAGLLHKIDLCIVDCVLADLRRKHDAGVPVVPVSVNISLRDLGRLNVAQEIINRVDAAGVDHGLLRVEFTESAASSDTALFKSQVQLLREAGFSVWMDDFGSGYSSLNTLQEFDFDLIKLDMEFIRRAQTEKSKVIIAAIIQAAGKMGVGTLAEGVETREQAEFLESIGCDMLQGYYFARPLSLDDVAAACRGDAAPSRESYDELRYWNAVSLLDLTDPVAEGEAQGVDGAPTSEVHAGVIERRDGQWRVLRANALLREFLHDRGLVAPDASSLEACVMPGGLDPEFYAALDRASRSRDWERISGKLEYGSGYQFFVRPAATTTDGTEAFAVMSVPTMLGMALGSYGDVPVAYAVFRVLLNDDGSEVVDAEYVYANDLYREWGGFGRQDLTGRSFLEVADHASRRWFPYCYRAVVNGECIHDMAYSPETGHWLSFNITPSPIEGCCVFAFALADDERREREELIAGRETSDLIISIADALGGEVSYDVAMNNLLEQMSHIIHPDRLYVYERGKTKTVNTFEWCAPGVEPQIQTLQSMDNEEFETWNRYLTGDSVVLIDDVSRLRSVDERLYQELRRQQVNRLLAVPFYEHDRLIGYLGADNYVLEERLDSMRLLKTMASFISARMTNRRLLEQLEQSSMHDTLTGLYNRHGSDSAIAQRMTERPGEPFVMALMDVDGFKTMNDSQGHGVGDAALVKLAQVVRQAFPNDAIVGRNGGDEFLVMWFGVGIEQMTRRLDEFVLRDLSCEYDGRRYAFSVSIGTVACPEQAPDLKSAYTMADAALYVAKHSRGEVGASKYRVYSLELEARYRAQYGFTPHDITENAPGAVLAYRDDDGKILFTNDELVDLFECDDLSDFMAFTGGVFPGVANGTITTKHGRARQVIHSTRPVRLQGVGTVNYLLLIAR